MMDSQEKRYETLAQIVERVKELADSGVTPEKDEMETLKSLFYRMHNQERDKQLKDYIDNGGDPERYVIQPDPYEGEFKTAMAVIRERRQKLFMEQEAEKQENLKLKQDIIEKIKTMATTPEEANQQYQEFKELQQQWREIKAVPAEYATELWRSYQLYVEQYYDLLKLNSEAREYDFKKNLEKKTLLCEAAERLANEADVISAFHQLQKLHQEFRETGPVAKDLREEIWQRFKAASTVINKRHQQHFDNLRAKEEENLAKKTALCERTEALVAEPNNSIADWEKHTKEMMDIQAEWKTIGFAPQKMNVKIFERFRTSCDAFFNAKTEYFKTLKETYKANVEKKRALIEKAKALKDSTEWKKTADKFIALQKEWKTIGMVPRKIGDQLWEEFLGICNEFFEARNKVGAGQRSEEHANLEKKRDVISRLKALLDEQVDDVQQTFQKLIEEYGAIGHVPFKDKDKVYDEYHAVLDELYDKLHVSVARKRLNNFKNKVKAAAEQGSNALDNERARLLRQYEQLKSEVQTYENNLGFLNASSKKGNSLIDEMNRKVKKLKDEIALIKDKIKAIDNAGK